MRAARALQNGPLGSSGLRDRGGFVWLGCAGDLGLSRRMRDGDDAGEASEATEQFLPLIYCM